MPFFANSECDKIVVGASDQQLFYITHTVGSWFFLANHVLFFFFLVYFVPIFFIKVSGKPGWKSLFRRKRRAIVSKTGHTWRCFLFLCFTISVIFFLFYSSIYTLFMLLFAKTSQQIWHENWNIQEQKFHSGATCEQWVDEKRGKWVRWMAKMVGAGKFKGESHTRVSCMNNLLVALKCEASLFYREVRLMASTFIQAVRKYVVNIYRLRSE